VLFAVKKGFHTFNQNLNKMGTNRRSFISKIVGAAAFAALMPVNSTLISSKQNPNKMNKNSLKVVAIAETSADKAEELKKVCLGLIEPTRKEKGCISYELYQDNSNPGTFSFIEEWESRELLDIHLKSPHLVAAVEAFGKIVTKDLVVLMLNKLS
jgi:quinol monooxygenase YgiN